MSNLKGNTYLFSNNAKFIEELYKKYTENPHSIEPSWQKYFIDNSENHQVNKRIDPPINAKDVNVVERPDFHGETGNSNNSLNDEAIKYSIAVNQLVFAYRTYGHLNVNLDPLGLRQSDLQEILDYRFYNIKESDLSRFIYSGGVFGFEVTTIADILRCLQNTYSNRIASEFMHIENTEERNWLCSKLESDQGNILLSKEEKQRVLQDLMEATLFEEYLHTKFPGTKRFSIEGGEASITSLEVILEQAAKAGMTDVVIGMAHRGRLVTLTKVMKKPYHAMLSEFQGNLAFPEELGFPGDVKYHLGATVDRKIAGKNIHLSLTPNPSHLEVVNSVVLGRVRAKQDRNSDVARTESMAILIHGDAAFSGQGSVSEMLSLSLLEGYRTGGTIHLVVNNQIGFTTNASDSRSSRYCTDLAKFIGAPIFHVNGDDAESVVYVSKLAMDYKARYKKDVVIDIVCYRKYGHNESDEPFFTQPVMYNVIENHKNPSDIYLTQLIEEGIVTDKQYNDNKSKFKTFLDNELELVKTYRPNKADWLDGVWNICRPSFDKAAYVNKTGVGIDKLKILGKKLCTVTNDFNLNSKIVRQLANKEQMFVTGENIDWGTGEALAFATLLDEGFPVRITGQDVERGTFSHRHAVLVDQKSERKYVPLNNLSSEQKAFLKIHNSNLSEFAVLGFEYGYSFSEPQALTIWEAQFGDFANGAQVIIDQYIASGEAKWFRMSGLVMLLPHGYEGQGPEHSSARLERFLQLCADDNMQVVNCTTPASFFHVLRRQIHRNYRKPLVVMTPKSLLRHKLAVSSLEDFAGSTEFLPILSEESTRDLLSPSQIKKFILCSGKIYYDLYEKRKELERKDVVIIRLEQFYPFPTDMLIAEIQKYPNAKIIWCQEEHKNMGAYNFVKSYIETILDQLSHKDKTITYVGRKESASPSVGYMKLHLKEQAALLTQAFEY